MSQNHSPEHASPEMETIISSIFGLDDMRVMHLFFKLKTVTHLIDQLAQAHRKERGVSSARMRLLIRLSADEKTGSEDGLSPSDLSRYSGVSRNTISSLLSGLEEQNLIERRLNPDDRRQFKIRITTAGQDVVHTHAPKFAHFIESVFEPLTPEECKLLLTLLDKLIHNLVEKAHNIGLHTPHTVREDSSPEDTA